MLYLIKKIFKDSRVFLKTKLKHTSAVLLIVCDKKGLFHKPYLNLNCG